MTRNYMEEFMRNDLFEKQASEDENIKSAIGEISADVLEKLASELGAIPEIHTSLEEKLASEECKDENCKKEECKEENCKEEKESSDKEEECKEEKESSNKEEEEEEKESSDKEEECKEEKESSDKEEEYKEEKESSDKEENCKEEKESSDKEEEEEKESETCNTCGGRIGDENDKPCCKENQKEASIQEQELIKEAYELAESKLIENGITLEGYVFDKCANEEITSFVCENAEKLASLSDKSILQVTDEILNSIANKLE